MRGIGLLLGVLALQLAAADAHAIIIRHDVDDERYVVDDADYPALVDLFEPGDCVGTLIHETYLLTVAHCAVDLYAGGYLEVGGNPHEIAEVILHPEWTDAEQFDIGLVRLVEAVEGVEPVPLYRAHDEVGQTLTLVGRGITATGREGEAGGTTDGKLRAATNIIGDADAHFLRILFDRPGEGATALEGVGASGDSGGPAFLEVDGVRYLAGLNSWGDDCNADVGQYDAADLQTRVSGFTAWIDSHVDTSALQPEEAPDGEARAPSEGSDFGAASCGCSVGARSGTGWALGLLLVLSIAQRRRVTADRR